MVFSNYVKKNMPIALSSMNNPKTKRKTFDALWSEKSKSGKLYKRWQSSFDVLFEEEIENFDWHLTISETERKNNEDNIMK